MESSLVEHLRTRLHLGGGEDLEREIERLDDITLRSVPVPPDGDCFFHSVVRIAQDIVAHEGPTSVLIRRLLRLCRVVSSEALDASAVRVAVARRVLDESDSQCTDMIRTWIAVHQDALREGLRAMIIETLHVHGVHADLTHADRLVLFKNMCDKQVWWADEFAIQVLERELPIRFVVTNEAFEVMRRDVQPLMPGTRVAFLSLRGLHYDPLASAKTGRLSFPASSIPLPMLLKMVDAGQVPSPRHDDIETRLRSADVIERLLRLPATL